MGEVVSKTRVKWFPPLDRDLGPFTEIALEEPVTVAEFLTRLCEIKPDLKRHVWFAPEDTRATGLLILRGSDLLKLTDHVDPGEEVEMMTMVEGG